MAAAAAAAAAATSAADTTKPAAGDAIVGIVMTAVAAAVATAHDDAAADAAADNAAIAAAADAVATLSLAADPDIPAEPDAAAAAAASAIATRAPAAAAGDAAATAQKALEDATAEADKSAAASKSAAAAAAALRDEERVAVAAAAAAQTAYDVATANATTASLAEAEATDASEEMETMMAGMSLEQRGVASKVAAAASRRLAFAKATLEAAVEAKSAAAATAAPLVSAAAALTALSLEATTKATDAANKSATAATAVRAATVAAAKAAFVWNQLTALHRVREEIIGVCKGGNKGHGVTPSSGTAGIRSRATGPQGVGADIHHIVREDLSIMDEIEVAAAGKLTAVRLGNLRKILARTGKASAAQLARRLAAVPAEDRAEVKPVPEKEGDVWVHRVWEQLAGEVVASLDNCFEGRIGHEVRLSTVYPEFKEDGNLAGVSGFTSITDFAHIEAKDPKDGNVVNARLKGEMKRNWGLVESEGVAQGEEQNCVTLLHMFTVHGVDKIIVVRGKWSYCVVSDGFYIRIVRTSVEANPEAQVAFLRTRVSPRLPLWSATIMAAAHPSGGELGAAGGAGGGGGGGAAAAAAGIPTGLFALACLLAADREFLGNRDVPLPTDVTFTVPAHEDVEDPIIPPVPPTSAWSFLGTGGFSTAYRVPWNGTPCVVKWYRHATNRERSLLQEALVLLKLEQRGVAGVPRAHGGAWGEVGYNGARHLYALLLSGAGLVLHNTLPGLSFLQRLAVVVHAAAAVLRVLLAAHAHGFAHRDIRPPNVIVLPAFIAPAKAAAAAAGAAATALAAAVAVTAAVEAAAAVAMLSDWGNALLKDASRDEQAADVTAAKALLHVALPSTDSTPSEHRASAAVGNAIVAELAHEGLEDPTRANLERCVTAVYSSKARTAGGLLRLMDPLRVKLAPFLPDWEGSADAAIGAEPA